MAKYLFPFHSTSPAAASSASSFPQFTLLPLELQLRVISLCEKPTLFQLMHTSRIMRAEATKLFFSDPEAVYSVDGEWLSSGSGYPDCTLYDLRFMAHIEYLFIDFHWMTASTWMNPADKADGHARDENWQARTKESIDENIRKFWISVQHLFPRLKQVTLGDDFDLMTLHKADQVPSFLHGKVGGMCPADIKLSVALLKNEDGSTRSRLKRRYWRRTTCQADTHANAKIQWEAQPSGYKPLIEMPHKALHGLLGTFQHTFIRYHDLVDKARAVRVFKIAAMEKHHFDNEPYRSFRCSVQDCDAVFEQPEEYTSHAMKTDHDKSHSLPEPFQHMFTENDERLKQMSGGLLKSGRQLQELWGLDGSSQRQKAKEEVMHQLKDDAPLDAPLHARDTPVSGHQWLIIMGVFIENNEFAKVDDDSVKLSFAGMGF